MDVPRDDECDLLLRHGKHAHDTEIQGVYRFAEFQMRRVQDPFCLLKILQLSPESRVFNECDKRNNVTTITVSANTLDTAIKRAKIP